MTAASRGMGAACARELHRRGYRLVLLARNDDVEALAKELGAIAVRGSVTSEADLKATVEAALAAHGRIDVVVNNTGHAAKGEVLELTDSQWHDGLDLLFLNVVRTARFATPAMLKQKGGAFVNISSFAARQPGVKFPVSGAMRAALGSFAQTFSHRYAAEGIRMNNVLPGWIDTYEVEPATVASIPAARAGEADEVARVVAFLASPESSYITGESLLVDGGLVRHG